MARESNTYQCRTCADNPVFTDHKEMLKHLREFHKITEATGTKKMISHMDFADSFSSVYEWEVGGIKFVQEVSAKREKSDPMWSDL